MDVAAIRSRRLNDEVVLGVQDKQLAAELESTYGQDLKKGKRITLDEWTKRGPVQRTLELVSQAFVQQY